MVSRRVSVSIDADLSQYNRGVLGASANTKKWVSDLEQADSRLSAIVQTGLALAPAIAPIGAAMVPAIAGLTTQLGFAAVAGGTAVLAFQGVGDALSALNKAQIKPSAENMAKLNETMDALGPAGVVFVHQLQEMRDEWQGLQDVAQQEMLPGVNEGIESLMTQMPAFERVIASVAGTMGDLAADAGASLAGPEWSEFFEYLEREARPILEQTGQAVGNMIEGITNMVMAFDPLSDGFVTGMLDMSEAFVGWSDGLDSSEGFQEFVRYVQESTPQALDTLQAIAGALIEFVEAAAPVGAVVLPVLEVMADTLAGIADSPAGPVIVGAAAAIGTLGRSLALLKAVGLRGGAGDSMIGKVLGTEQMKSYPAAVKSVTAANDSLISAQAALATQATKTRDAQFAMIPTADKRKAVQDFAKAQDEVRSATVAVADAEKARSGAMRESAKQFGKATLAVGGLAAMSSGAADSIGLTNTMSLAMMGTLAGPMGSAVGAGVGALLDLKDAGSGAVTALDGVRAASQSMDLSQMVSALEAGRSALQDYSDITGGKDFFGDIASSFAATFSGDFDLYGNLATENEELESQFKDLALGISYVGQSMGALNVPTEDLDELNRILDLAGPAMQGLGISTEDLAAAARDGSLSEIVADMQNWTTNADSAEGRTRNVAKAMRELDNEMIDTATSAETLEATLDSLLGPGMGLSAATDAWRDGLRNLNEELDKNKGSLFANTDAASQNRGVIRDRVNDLKEVLVAEANAGAGAGELSARLRKQRDALLDAGAAAGIARPQLNNYLDDLGLTPKLVKTLIKLEIKDAENKAANIQARLDKLEGMKPTPKVDAKIEAAEAALAKINGQLANLDGRSATTYVNTVYQSVRKEGTGFGPSALGNIFPSVQAFAYGDIANNHQPELAGPGATRIWREPETQGEAYVPLANDHRRPRARGVLEDAASILGGSVQWFATGGTYGGTKEDPKLQKKKPLKLGSDSEMESTVDMSQFLGRMMSLTDAQLTAAGRQLMASGIATQAAEDQNDAAQKALDASQTLYDGVASTAAGLFNIDPLARPDNVWAAGAGDPFASLQSVIDRTSAFSSGAEWLKGRGLDGAALAYGLSSEGNMSQLGGMSDADLQRFEDMFNQASAGVESAALTAANVTYGAEVAQQTAIAAQSEAHLAAMNAGMWALQQTVDQLTQRLEGYQQQAAEGRIAAAEATGAAVGGAVNGAAAKGSRDRANRPNRLNRSNR